MLEVAKEHQIHSTLIKWSAPTFLHDTEALYASVQYAAAPV